MDTRLVHPFTSIVAGPTGCGKTTFVVSLLRHSHTLVNLPHEKITWCYGEWQPLYSTLSTIHPNLECVEGLPDLSSFDPNNRNLVVIDDLMSREGDKTVHEEESPLQHVGYIFGAKCISKRERESDHQSKRTIHGSFQESSRQHTSSQFSETDVSGSCKIHARGIQRRNVRTSRLPIRRLETVHTGTLAPAQ